MPVAASSSVSAWHWVGIWLPWLLLTVTTAPGGHDVNTGSAPPEMVSFGRERTFLTSRVGIRFQMEQAQRVEVAVFRMGYASKEGLPGPGGLYRFG